jgi:alkylresorcinol/alkylpyrone synthase
MYLQSIAHATPDLAITQSESWEILQQSDALTHLSDRSVTLLEKILLADSGIAQRHLAVESVESLFSLNAEALNNNFEACAPRLAGSALSEALAKAGLKATDLDALLICTCTGYLCPGLTSYVSEQLGLRPNAYLQDIVGLGCGAAIPTLRSAAGFIAANPHAKVATVAVELCSSAFFLNNDPGVLVSACLFGDAASASIWSGDAFTTGYCIKNFDTIHLPEHRELIRFVNSGGKLCNKLHRSVPDKVAQSVLHLYKQNVVSDQTPIANHTGGRDVIDALEQSLGADLTPSRRTLRDYGNTSSPSVLITLEAMLDASSPDRLWLTSFGAGFAAHSCVLEQS